MVRYSQEFSVSVAARIFGRTRKTVRKWSDRFTKDGLSGLTDRSRRPHYSPNKTSQRDKDKIYSSEKAIEAVDATYRRIPPSAKNHQSDVERANGLIEYELLEIKRWKTKSELVGLTIPTCQGIY